MWRNVKITGREWSGARGFIVPELGERAQDQGVCGRKAGTGDSHFVENKTDLAAASLLPTRGEKKKRGRPFIMRANMGALPVQKLWWTALSDMKDVYLPADAMHI